MANKPLPSILLIGLTSVLSFSLLFATNLLVEPIFIDRANQSYLSLLDLDSFNQYEIGETEIATGSLLTAGIQSWKTFSQNGNIVAVTYDVVTTGFKPGLSYRIGIRDGLIRKLIIDAHAESTGYGAEVLPLFPDAITNIAIDEVELWTAALISVSTGSSATRRGIVNSLTVIAEDYLQRVGGAG